MRTLGIDFLVQNKTMLYGFFFVCSNWFVNSFLPSFLPLFFSGYALFTGNFC